jgi:hypothetical protein
MDELNPKMKLSHPTREKKLLNKFETSGLNRRFLAGLLNL